MKAQSKKIDYNLLVCSFITLLSIAAGIFFPNSLPRILEALRDVLTSFLIYLNEYLLPFEIDVPITINEAQSWTIADELWDPITFLPDTWESFVQFWDSFIKLLLNKENIKKYFSAVGKLIYHGSRYMILLLPMFLFIYIKMSGYKDEYCTERGKKSRPLQIYERFYIKTIFPIRTALKSFRSYFKDHDEFIKAWLVIWAVHFNVVAILIAVCGYYFYFVSTWDFLSIYTQLLKLQRDLSPMIRAVPGILWVAFGIWLYNSICRSRAFDRLDHGFECNMAFLRARGVSTVYFGEMGIGKTRTITAQALFKEIQIFVDMFNTMLKYDHYFPNFPWQKFRDELKRRMARREIVDLTSCRECISKMGEDFEYIKSHLSFKQYQKIHKNHRGQYDKTFGYDYDHYATTYNNELKIISLFEAAEEYACAYYVFTLKTTLLFANYSIRVDTILDDIGNMPLRDTNLFRRDPEYSETYSKYAHIIDFDMIRLGKQMIEDNEQARTLMPGVYVVSEIDKERKNALKLKETKINQEECNQKNDMYESGLMMSRHSNIVDYKPVVFFICDLQRPEEWGAGGRELGEVFYIAEKSECVPVLPFYSPYWLLEGIYQSLRSKWDNWYSEYIHNRSDETLFVYAAKNIMAAIGNHYDKINGLFGESVLNLEYQSGRLDGNVKKEKWRAYNKIELSDRYSTDCLKGVWESYVPNRMHIDDYLMYMGIRATKQELAMQNSHFQNDVNKMRGN